ncbi:MAG: DUF58 domain-containing protein [Deltaproteobacteria bacterium]|nr:DUF58 domain-containing protein [Deltaproteobacteria bacterium]
MTLRARTIVEGALSGLHRSPHHGSSVEFAEHKEYSPGDEIRHIDWKAYGKFDRYYVKRFEEETELTAYVLLDRSGSMTYRGDGISKLEYAAYLTAALAYLLIRQQDRVGLLAFGGAKEPEYMPPRAHAAHLHDLMAAIERVAASATEGETSLAKVLDRVAELARRRKSLIVLCSDMFDRSPEIPKLLRRLRVMRHDVAVVQVLDEHELTLPFEGVTLFQSLEDDRRLLVDPRAIRHAYLKELRAFLDRTRSACTEGDVEYFLVPTTRPLERTLLDFLISRSSRAGARVKGSPSSSPVDEFRLGTAGHGAGAP